jgi:2,3-bisphosphoglycerate-independent phosphoglycerate mutase
VKALADHDFVLVHIEATDSAGHAGSAAQKVAAIEAIDEQIVGPLLKQLRRRNDLRLMVLPDHPTPVAVRTHTAEPVPFAFCGPGVEPLREDPFDEESAERAGILIDPGHELMDYFLHTGL